MIKAWKNNPNKERMMKNYLKGRKRREENNSKEIENERKKERARGRITK